jgi:P-type Ca2+ transporter type 2C
MAATPPFHSLPYDEVTRHFGTDPKQGLTGDAASELLRKSGPNELTAAARDPLWKRLAVHFRETLTVLLLIAAAISFVIWYLEREAAFPIESAVILAIVVLNVAFGFLQEEQAEKALSALRQMSAPEARVVRDGQTRRLPARDLVPGDVILIEEGDTIPADSRLVEIANLQTVEASLTGESQPVRKKLDPVDREAAVGDRLNMLFAGTTANYGHARAVVVATGMNTEIGRIATMLEQAESDATPLQKELDRTGKALGIAVVVLAIVIVGVLLISGGRADVRAWLDALLFGVALAVAAVPEGLAAIVTVVLALGVKRMAGRGAIVRKLPAVETLGSATVIASDKTGTLTRSEMTVRAVATAKGLEEGESNERHSLEGSSPSLLGLPEEVVLHVVASLANNAEPGQGSGKGDPTEVALLNAAEQAGIGKAQVDEWLPRLQEQPFSSERKRMSTLHQFQDGQAMLAVKGAPDVILERCGFEYVDGEVRPLTDERRRELQERNRELGEKAYRTMAFAFRDFPAPDAPGDLEPLETDLVFAGMAGIIDPPRPEAAEAVGRAHGAGVRTLMMTGDHPATALAVAREIGIRSEGGAMTGRELEELDAKQLASVLERTSVFARVDPAHKMRIVDALQAQGAIVAMTGDGVNDAPALKSADIGVAMGITGTDVSKEAADIILTDDNFATIVAAVEEGRTVFRNIRKFLQYLLSSNCGEILTIFLAVIFARVLGLSGLDDAGVVLPLVTTQILWINLITDGPPALALGVDPPEPGVMKCPPRPRTEHVITPRMWWELGLVGLVMACGTLLVFDANLPGGLIEGSRDVGHARTMAFTTLVLFQLFNALNAHAGSQSFFRSFFSNHWLVASLLVSAALQIAVVHVPWMQRAFSTQPLGLSEWLVCAAVASSVVVAMEVYKLATRGRRSFLA